MLPCFIFSQSTKIDYARWKYPEVKIRAFSLDNSYHGRMVKDYGEDEDKNVNAQGYIQPRYSVFLNDSLTQIKKVINGNTFFSDNNFNYNLDYQYEYRKYFRNNNSTDLYYETRPYINLGFGKLDNNNHDRSINASLGVHLGKGRIEPMRDVFVAQFMLDDMIAENLLDSVYNKDLIFELAEIMIIARSQRVFDGRMARKYQLKSICDFLVSKGLREGIDMFNVVNDHWFNTAYNDRSIGKRLSFGMVSYLRQLYALNGISPPFSHKTGYVGLQMDYQYAKPINQFWQKDIQAAVSVVQDPNSFISRGYLFRSHYQYSYYPTTRTWFTGSANTYFSTHDFKTLNIIASLDIKASVFVTNTIRINGNISFRRHKRTNEGEWYLLYQNNYASIFDSLNLITDENFRNINTFQFSYGISMGYFFF